MFECSRGSTYFWHGSLMISAELTSYECLSLRSGRQISSCTTSKLLYTCPHSHLLNTGKYQGMAEFVTLHVPAGLQSPVRYIYE